jgi:hypothetical protein
MDTASTILGQLTFFSDFTMTTLSKTITGISKKINAGSNNIMDGSPMSAKADVWVDNSSVTT